MDEDKLHELQERIEAQKQRINPQAAAQAKSGKDTSEADANNMRAGMRAGTELVGSLVGGGLIGYGLDHVFEISPRGLMIGLFLGVIVAFWNLYKLTKTPEESASKVLPHASKTGIETRK